MLRLLLIAALVIPLGLDLYMPVPEDNLLDPELRPLGLSESEKRVLVAFLRALSGELTR